MVKITLKIDADFDTEHTLIFSCHYLAVRGGVSAQRQVEEGSGMRRGKMILAEDRC